MKTNHKVLSKHMPYNPHPKQFSKGLFQTQRENYKACPNFRPLFPNEQNPHYSQSKKLTIKFAKKDKKLTIKWQNWKLTVGICKIVNQKLN